MVDRSTKPGRAAFALALAVAGVGVAVLAGWIADLETLKRVAPRLVAMNPVTAVAFILGGVSLALQLQRPNRPAQAAPSGVWPARLCAFGVAFIGLARLAEFLGAWDIGIDHWLFAAKLPDGLEFDSRMAPNTALNLLLLGLALLLLDSARRPVRLLVESCAVVAIFGSLLALVGYTYDIEAFYGFGQYTRMALHTALAFAGLGVALLLAHTDRGMLAVFAGAGHSGAMMRRLLPAAVLVPALLGWLTLLGQRAGYLAGGFGSAVFALGNILAFTFLVCWHAREIHRVESGRNRAEEAMREGEERFASAFEYAPIGVALLAPDGRWLRVNRALCALVGYSEAELLTRTFQDITYPADLDADLDKVRQLLAGSIRGYQMEKRYVHRLGHLVTIQLNVSLVRDGQGRPGYFVSQIQDITERKQAAEALRASQANMAAAQRIGHFGSWEIDLTVMDGAGVNPLRWSDEMYRIAGFEPGTVEASSEFFFRLVPAAEHELVRQAVADALRERRPYTIIHRFLRPDGQACVVRETGQFFFDETTGRPLKIIGTAHDITERNQAEAELRANKKRLRSLIDGLGPSMLVGLLTPGGLVLEANTSALAVAGLEPADVLGRPLEEARWFAYSPEVQRRLRTAIGRAARGEASRFDLQMRGTGDELIDVDFALNPVRDESGEVAFLVPSGSVITERKEVETALRESEARYRSLIDHARDAIFTVGMDGNFLSLNPAVETIAGLARADWIGQPFAGMVHPDDLPLAREMFHRSLQGAQVPVHELRGNPRLNRPALMEITLTALRDQGGKIIGALGIGRDNTERKRLEGQLLQSQKLETVGKLAGGVAHEFNSILTAIIGQSEFLLRDLPAGSPLAESAFAIRRSADRAAILTRQLLAYGRKQFLRPEILDLNAVLAGMEETLRHLVGRSTAVCLVPAAGLNPVHADAAQIEEVVTILAMNAADAMPYGGKLTLATANAWVDQKWSGASFELKSGSYALLTITDTGKGMAAEVKARAFEPFFSTKDVGQGTGLGLSTCYGIIKQSGGHISVESEPGRGTVFKIYLPQVTKAPAPAPVLAPTDLPTGIETILVVEDDSSLRDMEVTLLRGLGYTVWPAANGLDALQLAQANAGQQFDLLFTDSIMPGMNGRELAERMRMLYPQAKVLFTSGYGGRRGARPDEPDSGGVYLPKPFTPSELALMVRTVLDQPGVPSPEPAAVTSGLT